MTQKSKRKIVFKILLVIVVAAVLLIIGVIAIPKLIAKPYFLGYSENADGTYSVSVAPEYEKNSKSVDVIKIPDKYKGKPITRVKYSGLGGIRNEINEIIVPEGIIAIEYHSFGEFVNLKKLTLPSTLQEIGGYIAPGSVELNFQSNDYFTFENGCIVENSTNTAVFGVNGCIIPEGVTTIGEGAFDGVTIANTYLPTSITKIDDRGFFSATFNFDKLVLTANIREIGFCAFSYATGFNNTLQVSTIGSIDSYAFDYCTINTLILDVDPTVVGQYNKLYFSSKITAYYENENMPVLSTSKEIESDLPGYRKYQV